MSKKRGFRLITMLTVCILLVGSFSMTAFAYADDTDPELACYRGNTAGENASA